MLLGHNFISTALGWPLRPDINIRSGGPFHFLDGRCDVIDVSHHEVLGEEPRERVAGHGAGRTAGARNLNHSRCHGCSTTLETAGGAISQGPIGARTSS